MRSFYKTMLLRVPIILLVSGAVAFGLSARQANGFLQVVRTVFGGVQQYLLIQKTAFLLFSVLLQYYSADPVIYSIRNSEYLSIRYGSRNKAFGALYRLMIIYSLGFAVLIIGGCYIGCALGNNLLDCVCSADAMELFVRCFFLCWIMVLVQGSLLMKCTPALSFVFMTALGVFLSFSSCVPSLPFTVLPIKARGLPLVIQITTDLLAIIIATSVFHSLQTKELCLCRKSY